LSIEFSLRPSSKYYIRSPVGYVMSFTKLAECAAQFESNSKIRHSRWCSPGSGTSSPNL
jgi:hypothetical protein